MISRGVIKDGLRSSDILQAFWKRLFRKWQGRADLSRPTFPCLNDDLLTSVKIVGNNSMGDLARTLRTSSFVSSKP